MAWDRRRFDDFIGTLGLRFFSSDEFLIHINQTGNHPPDDSSWHNIVPTARLLDMVRAHYGRATVVSSCYRAREYHRRVGGGERSQHLAFTAVDFSVASIPASEVSDLLRNWRGRWIEIPFRVRRTPVTVPEGPVPFADLEERTPASGAVEVRFAGGIGSYTRFTHLDTRGINAGWSGL